MKNLSNEEKARLKKQRNEWRYKAGHNAGVAGVKYAHDQGHEIFMEGYRLGYKIYQRDMLTRLLKNG